MILLQHGHRNSSDVFDKLLKYEFLRFGGLKRVLQLGQTYMLSFMLRLVHIAITTRKIKTPKAPYKNFILPSYKIFQRLGADKDSTLLDMLEQLIHYYDSYSDKIFKYRFGETKDTKIRSFILDIYKLLKQNNAKTHTLTHYVGINKEKELRKVFAQKRCFASRFYSFVFYCQFHTFPKKHCRNCVFVVLFVLNMLEI